MSISNLNEKLFRRSFENSLVALKLDYNNFPKEALYQDYISTLISKNVKYSELLLKKKDFKPLELELLF